MGEFGNFITEKRKVLNMSLRTLAKELGISPSYASDIEKGNRKPNDKSLLDSLVKVLQLNQEETNTLYDLSASQKENALAQDVTEYVNENEIAKIALRKAKAKGATEADWQKFINDLEKR